MLKGASLNAAPLFWIGLDGPGEKVLNSRSFSEQKKASSYDEAFSM